MRAELFVVGALAACSQPPQVIVICHNANCSPAGGGDDTLAALEGSLALEPSPFDGIEYDLVAPCHLGHDIDEPSAPAAEATARIADFIAGGHARGDRFHLMIELKRGAPDLAELAGCALDQFEILRDAAALADLPLNLIFESFEPDQLAALIADPRWPGQQRGAALDVRLSASLSFPAPLGYSHTLAEFGDRDVQLDVVDIHPALLSSDKAALYDDLGLELALYSDTTSTALLETIASTEPTYVISSDLPLLRAWLER